MSGSDLLLMLLGAGTMVSILVAGSRFRILFGILAIWTSGLVVGLVQLSGGRATPVDLLAWLGFGWVASAFACTIADILLTHAKIFVTCVFKAIPGREKESEANQPVREFF